MSKLYQITVTHSVGKGGVGTYLTTGDAVEVDGQPHVRLPHGTIVPAAGWHSSLAEAQKDAATKIAQLGVEIVSQAKCMWEASNG